MRLAEYTLSFEHIEICKTALAHLAMRERVFLYSLVYSLAPRWILEIGTFKGGSAQIISGALDDLALDGKLITIDPHPEQIDIDGTLIAHNCTFVQGFFPKDIDKILPPGGERYDLVFVDGDHAYEAVLQDLKHLRGLLNRSAYVLLHDAYHAGVEKAVNKAITSNWYQDCGRIGRVRNDICGAELYGGFHLLVNAHSPGNT